MRVGVVEARVPALLHRREGPSRALGAMELGAHSVRGRHGAWQGGRVLGASAEQVRSQDLKSR